MGLRLENCLALLGRCLLSHRLRRQLGASVRCPSGQASGVALASARKPFMQAVQKNFTLLAGTSCWFGTR